VENIVFSSGSNLRKIGREAFQKSALESIHIPSSVELIDRSAFKACVQLRTVFLEPEAKRRKIFPSAFQGCSKLENRLDILGESTSSEKKKRGQS